MAVKTTQIDGDMSLGRNIAMGGKATIAGSTQIGQDLVVKGWLDAPNIKAANKGVFTSLEALEAAYPEPQDGWFAGIGDSTPFTAYTGQDGSWVATGGTIDITTDMTRYTENIEQLQQDSQEAFAGLDGLEAATTLGQDEQGNDVKPSDVQAAMPTKEFMELKTDSEGNILWAIEKDGHTRFYLPVTFEGDTYGVKDARLDGYEVIISKEWKQLVLDEVNNIIFGIKTNGDVVISSTMDASLSKATLNGIISSIKKDYDETINILKAEAYSSLEKYQSLASGISQADIDNGTSKYHEIARASSNPNMSVKACSILYNLMKLEKEGRFLTTFFLNIDYRNTIRKNAPYTVGGQTYASYKEQFRVANLDGTYSPKQPDNPTFSFTPFSNFIEYKSNAEGNPWVTENISDRTQLIYIFDLRAFTDIKDYGIDLRAETRAIFLTLIKKMWVDYKAIPVFCWHEGNPYTPYNWRNDTQVQAYNYTYDDPDYPQNHRYVIKEILDEVEYGDHTNTAPSNDDTKCGFGRDEEEREGLYDAPYIWFDAKCQEVGQFIKDLNEFIGEEIPMIFRLWHECEDSWQWWGASMVEVEDYKAFFRLTVEKINRYSESNSILYGYCTDRNFDSPLDKAFGPYELRYPGDNYVDIVGYDDYFIGSKDNYLPVGIDKAKVVSAFAKAHSKPAFIWESGDQDGTGTDFFNTWVSVFNTPGINFSALMGWPYYYPPYNIKPPYTEASYQKMQDLLLKYKQFYNRSNMPCAEEGFDLTTIIQ